MPGRKSPWRLEYRNGKRFRVNFKTKALAKAHMDDVELSIDRAGTLWVKLSAPERNEIMAVHGEVQAAGYTMRQVWEDFRRLRSTEEDKPVVVTAKQVRDELIELKEKAGKDDLYIASLRQLIDRFISGRDVLAVGKFSHTDIEAHLELFPNNKATIRSRLATFFQFCVRRGYRVDNPCDRLETLVTKHTRRVIFSIKQVTDALQWLQARPRAGAWFVLSTFAGLRPEEAMQTTWDDIQFKNNWVVVEHQTTKIRERRVVEPRPGVIALLERFKEKGATLPLTRKQLSVEQRAIRGIIYNSPDAKWPQDVTRHSAASYMLAEGVMSSEQIAVVLATSVKKLHSNYKAIKSPDGQILTAEVAKEFWQLLTAQ